MEYCRGINNWEGLLPDSLLITDEESDIPETEPSFIEWVNNESNSVVLRSLTSGNFEDFKCIGKYIGRRDMVQLGEAAHCTREFSRIKVRLIKYLHEELGFDVIAFESDFFGCNYSNDNMDEYTAKQLLFNSTYGVWWNDDVLELFEYIKETQTTSSPLILSGFDIFGGQFFSERYKVLYEVISKLDSSYAEEVSIFDNKFLKTRINNGPYLNFYYDSAISMYNEIWDYIDENHDFLQSHYDEKPNYISFLLNSINSTKAAAYYTLNIYKENEKEARFIRDSMMAANISFLKDIYFPSKKMIIWAHNGHIAYNPDLKSIYLDDKVMGTWLKEKYNESIYSIGLFAGRGEAGAEQNPHDTLVVPLPSTSYNVGTILYNARKKYLFLDMKDQKINDGNKWMFYTINTLSENVPHGFAEEGLILKDEFDGLIYIDSVSVPYYLY